MEAGVLDCDRELARERQEQSLIALPEEPRPAPVDHERADRLVLDGQGHEQRPPDPRLLDDVLEPCQPRVVARIFRDHEAARTRRAECQLEEPLGQILVATAELSDDAASRRPSGSRR